ncbi:MAG: cell division protein FtsZ [Alphaproteobacteria bacterium]|nr:cell division protein FtsZ [Alphaproteobacteria bacterium]
MAPSPKSQHSSLQTDLDLRPRIMVIGVGGAGGNAVNNMIRAKLEGVEFIIANTDAQAVAQSLVEGARRIQLGLQVTQGLGAGSKPDVGRAAAEESIEEIIESIQGCNMVFITAGMGGGTGTGAGPVIARAAREAGILTVGVVSKPFHFEGTHRMRTADRGIDELQQYVDTLIIIPNQNLFRIANERTTFADAFKLADDVLYSGVRGVTDLMMMPGLINLDFADIRAVMAEMGKAMMGTGEADGERRALDAAEAAISNPLLDDVSMKGAKGVLINITGGYDMTLYEVDEAANRIREDVDPNANIIFGSTFDEKLNGRVRVSVVATGIGPLPTQQTVGAQAPAAVSQNFGANADTLKTAAQSNDGHVHSQFQSSYDQDAFSDVIEKPVTVEDIKEAGYGVSNDNGHFVSNDDQAVVHNDDAIVNLSKAPQQHFEAPERKRPASLFERFTGVSRQKATNDKQPIDPGEGPDNSQGDSDVLEIPAFLRRGG